MTVSDLIQRLRTYLNDTAGVEFSDTELLTYINQSIDVLSQMLADFNTNLNRKETTLTFVDGKAPVPSDFLRDVSVKDGTGAKVPYRVVGNEVAVSPDVSEAVLDYYFFYPSVSSPDDLIPVPKLLENAFFYFVAVLAKNRIQQSSKVEGELSQIFIQYALPVLGRYGNPPFALTPPVVV